MSEPSSLHLNKLASASSAGIVVWNTFVSSPARSRAAAAAAAAAAVASMVSILIYTDTPWLPFIGRPDGESLEAVGVCGVEEPAVGEGALAMRRAADLTGVCAIP